VIAGPCRATRARRPLVAGLGHVLEVQAAGTLQQIAADGGHVPQLAGCPGQHRLGQYRELRAHLRVGGQIAVAHPRANPQAATHLPIPLHWPLDPVGQQPGDIDEHVGRDDPELHQVHQVGPAAEEGRAGMLGHDGDRGRWVGRRDVAERLHRAARWGSVPAAPSPATSSIAATMLT
jgi:hypothetical protein